MCVLASFSSTRTFVLTPLGMRMPVVYPVLEGNYRDRGTFKVSVMLMYVAVKFIRQRRRRNRGSSIIPNPQ